MSVKELVPPKLRKIVKRFAGMTHAPAVPEPPEKLASDAREYWSESATAVAQRDMSHWLGEGRWNDQATWWRIGDEHFEYYRKLLQLTGRATPIRTMLEWGQGGGANAVRFAKEVETFFAVDISEPNLCECARQLDSRGHTNFRAILIDPNNPEQALANCGTRVDFFLSTAVFQHFPTKDYGVRVTKVARQLLVDDGIALIQTRYDNGTDRFKPKTRDYRNNVTYFTSYMIDEYWMTAADLGFRPLSVILVPRTNYAYYLLAAS